MTDKNIFLQLRTQAGLSQDELAEKVFVTRQAVSRWENGETTPNTETLKLLATLFNVSVNTLLDLPEALCQCCGKPLDEALRSREKDGAINAEYCKWCYVDGSFTLDFYQQYAKIGGTEMLDQFKQQLINEINALQIEGLPPVENLAVLPGHFVNLEYRLPNGQPVKFLDDNTSYLGNQLECIFGGERCFGIVANMEFLLVCSYEKDGINPELIAYYKR